MKRKHTLTGKIPALIFSIILGLALTGCGSSKTTTAGTRPEPTTPPRQNPVAEQTEPPGKPVASQTENTSATDATTLYIRQYAPIAEKKMKEYHIPSSITLAQGILESRSGQSTLTKKSNNHFGIKCHKDWQGKKTYHDDDKKGECFRVYDKAEQSFDDHSEFLTTRKRYRMLFELPKGDYIGWAFGLRQTGYATDNRYPHKLIGIIEKNELYKYDREALGADYEKESKNTLYYKVKQGDNLSKIAKIKGIPVEKITRYNRLEAGATIHPGEILLLKPVDYLKKSIPGSAIWNDKRIAKLARTTPAVATQDITPDFHIVEEGETLFAISRVYRIPIKLIKVYNHMSNSKIKIGQKLYLKPGLYALEHNEKPREVATDSKPETDTDTDNTEDAAKDKETKEEKPDSSLLETLNKISGDNNKKEDEATADKETGKEEISEQETNEEAEKTLLEALNKPSGKKENEVSEPVTPETSGKTNTTPTVVQVERRKTGEIPDYHIVQEGETLYSIAYKYDLEIPLLRRLNNVKKNEVYIGQRIRLKESAPVVIDTRNESEKISSYPETYTVKQGDTLYSIAKKFKMSVARLKSLNHMKDNTIYVGQVLYIR